MNCPSPFLPFLTSLLPEEGGREAMKSGVNRELEGRRGTSFSGGGGKRTWMEREDRLGSPMLVPALSSGRESPARILVSTIGVAAAENGVRIK